MVWNLLLKTEAIIWFVKIETKTGFMKLMKLTLVLMASGSFVGLSTGAHASTGFTPISGTFTTSGIDLYTFTSSTPDTFLNGSTIAIMDNSGSLSIAGWDMFDNNSSGIGNTVEVSSLVTSSVYTPGVSLISGPGMGGGYITSATATGFTGSYTVSNYFSSGDYSSFAQWYGDGTDSTSPGTGDLSDEIVTSVNGGLNYTDVVDPPGSWAFAGSIPVPDAASTFELLLAGAGTMEIYRRRFGYRSTFIPQTPISSI